MTKEIMTDLIVLLYLFVFGKGLFIIAFNPVLLISSERFTQIIAFCSKRDTFVVLISQRLV